MQLNFLVAWVIEKFDLLSTKKVRKDRKTFDDYEMYAGAGGVLYGLYKYSLLLGKETDYKEPNWLEPMLKKGLNIGLFKSAK